MLFKDLYNSELERIMQIMHVTERLVVFDSLRKFLLYPAHGFYSLCYFSCSVFQGAHGKCASAL